MTHHDPNGYALGLIMQRVLCGPDYVHLTTALRSITLFSPVNRHCSALLLLCFRASRNHAAFLLLCSRQVTCISLLLCFFTASAGPATETGRTLAVNGAGPDSQVVRAGRAVTDSERRRAVTGSLAAGTSLAAGR